MSRTPPEAAGERRPRPERMLRALRRIVRLAKPYRGRLVLSVFLTGLAAVMTLVVPLGLRELIDAVFQDGNRRLLNLLALGLLVLFIVQALVSFAGSYMLGTTGARIVTDLRLRLFNHLNALGLRYFGRQRTGELTSRLNSDVWAVRTVVTDSLVTLLTQTLTLTGSLALMVFLNWRLSVVVLLIVPVVTVLARLMGRAMRGIGRRMQDQLAETTAIAEETLSAIRLVKAFAREPHAQQRFGDATEDLYGTEKERIRVRTMYGSLISALFFSALVAIFWFGGTEVLAGRLTAGDLVAFIFYAMNIARGVSGLSSLFGSLSSAVGASDWLFAVLETDPEITSRSGAVNAESVRGEVRFDHVSFAYLPDRPVLADIHLAVGAGETVALVGPSGGGKSTLLNLLPRFYDPASGSVRIDGRDVRDYTVPSLRNSIAVVPQEVFLFNASVEENVRFGRLDASPGALRQALEDANAAPFVDALPQGQDTVVGERGITLSGGERQRLAIARALLRDAPILLLDEPTSSLDSGSEALIQEALDRLTAGRTTFIIAHRLSTVRHADRIVVLDHGRIVQQGTHDALMAEGGLYQELADRQFLDPNEEVAEVTVRP